MQITYNEAFESEFSLQDTIEKLAILASITLCES